MLVQPRLNFDARKVALGVRSDRLCRKFSDPRINTTREVCGFTVAGLEFERFIAVEGQDLRGGYAVALGEDDEFGVLIRILGAFLPFDLDGVRLNVVDSEITNAEHGREHSAGEGGAAGDGFILVEGGGKGFSGEDGLNLCANSGDTSAPADELDGIDLFESEASILQDMGEGVGYTIEDASDEGLVFLPRQP